MERVNGHCSLRGVMRSRAVLKGQPTVAWVPVGKISMEEIPVTKEGRL